MAKLFAKIGDPDQTPHSAAGSALFAIAGLGCPVYNWLNKNSVSKSHGSL